MNKQTLIKDIKTKISSFQSQMENSEKDMVKYRRNSLGYKNNSENVIRYQALILSLKWVLGELENIQ